MQKITLNQIDTKTHEGRLLFAALIELTTREHTKKTPEQVIDYLYNIANHTDEANKVEEPWTDKGNVYFQIDQLANLFTQKMPDQIREGSAIDNAIRLLQKPNQGEAVFGFIKYLREVPGIEFRTGYSPMTLLTEIFKYCKDNDFPTPKPQ